MAPEDAPDHGTLSTFLLLLPTSLYVLFAAVLGLILGTLTPVPYLLLE